MLESALLHLHCLARTEQLVNFGTTVATCVLLLERDKRMNKICDPLWSALETDVTGCRGVERQLLMRLLDDSIIDYPLSNHISAVLHYFPLHATKVDEDRRHQLLKGSTRALERQICRGTLQNLDQFEYSHLGEVYCGIVK